jgi:hypothetical protein
MASAVRLAGLVMVRRGPAAERLDDAFKETISWELKNA